MVTQADVDAGQIGNLGTVEGTDPNGDPQTDSDPKTVDVPQFPAIDMVKSGVFNDEDGDTFGDEGETITYGFDVTDNGNVTLSNIVVITQHGTANSWSN
ncbi:MAG TPA: hypothetical protein VLG28_17360 [Acidimicrobiia bacterium]|nr:hypothetical protein [Acidimicrobiia bacterium]